MVYFWFVAFPLIAPSNFVMAKMYVVGQMINRCFLVCDLLDTRQESLYDVKTVAYMQRSGGSSLKLILTSFFCCCVLRDLGSLLLRVQRDLSSKLELIGSIHCQILCTYAGFFNKVCFKLLYDTSRCCSKFCASIDVSFQY